MQWRCPRTIRPQHNTIPLQLPPACPDRGGGNCSACYCRHRPLVLRTLDSFGSKTKVKNETPFTSLALPSSRCSRRHCDATFSTTDGLASTREKSIVKILVLSTTSSLGARRSACSLSIVIADDSKRGASHSVDLE
jgi:hypothetical protein